MKKVLFLVMSLLVACLTTACAGQAASADQSSNQKEQAVKEYKGGDSKILVAYFSCTGNTKELAEKSVAVLGADIYEIVPKEPYTNKDLDYNDETSRVSREHQDASYRPQIAANIGSLDKYDTIVLAYPIWWGEAPNIMATFMESCDFSGKKIVPVCTAASSDIGSSVEHLQALAAPTAEWKPGSRLSPDITECELVAWFGERQIKK